MKEALKLWHLARHKAAILTDRVAAHWRFTTIDPFTQKLDGFSFRFRQCHRATTHTVDQS